MVDAQLDGTPEQGDSLVVAVVQPRELCRAVADPGYGATGKGSGGGVDDESPWSLVL
ncbi:hypothetical protein ACFVAV_14690 [Nocardia sp. NPDC057663]|uniref:hypothetical protein n=1 Tax=Nocardia sp. NPDC057663 TaxID=3346201 RepID=UPI00366F790F